MLWDDVSAWQPHRLVTRLFLRASPFLVGDGMRDLLVKEIASHLYHQNGLRPCTQSAANAECESESDVESDGELLRKSLRENGGRSKEWWQSKSCPMSLRPQAQQAVEAAIRRGSTRGALVDLPLFAGEKPRTRSSMVAARQKWLQSEEATLRRLDRKSLFSGHD